MYSVQGRGKRGVGLVQTDHCGAKRKHLPICFCFCRFGRFVIIKRVELESLLISYAPLPFKMVSERGPLAGGMG